jgi:glyceraldehyde 3-phosphate dehydrogenase
MPDQEGPMTVRLAINGFGRTGRSFLRAALGSTHDFDIVAVNDLGPPVALARLFARDSVHGRYPEPVEVEGDSMVVGARRIVLLAEPEPKALPWRELGVDVVIAGPRRQHISRRARAAS